MAYATRTAGLLSKTTDMRESREETENVDYPFILDLEHAPLSPVGMFQASKAFDLHENGEGCSIVVDVLEVTPTRTSLHVKPARPMPYETIAVEVDNLIQEIGRRVFDGNLAMVRLQWIVKPMGVPSSQRQGLKSIT